MGPRVRGDEAEGITPSGQMMLGHVLVSSCPPKRPKPAVKNDQILSQISEFCRQVDMA